MSFENPYKDKDGCWEGSCYRRGYEAAKQELLKMDQPKAFHLGREAAKKEIAEKYDELLEKYKEVSAALIEKEDQLDELLDPIKREAEVAPVVTK